MPIYEYRCTECGKTFEEIVSSSAVASLPCPACESKKTEKLMSRIGGIGMGKSGSNDFACGSRPVRAPPPAARADAVRACSSPIPFNTATENVNAPYDYNLS